MIRTRPLLGALVTAAVAAFMLAAYGGSSEGTVVAKTDQGVYDYACQTGATMTGPVAVPVWGVCSVPKCWRLVVRNIDRTVRTMRQPRGVRPHATGRVLAWTDRPLSHPVAATGHRLLERPAARIGDRCSERSMSPQAV